MSPFALAPWQMIPKDPVLRHTPTSSGVVSVHGQPNQGNPLPHCTHNAVITICISCCSCRKRFALVNQRQILLRKGILLTYSTTTEKRKSILLLYMSRFILDLRRLLRHLLLTQIVPRELVLRHPTLTLSTR